MPAQKYALIIILAIVLFINHNSAFCQEKNESIYWVGGSGSWSDFFRHWANSSGGDSKVFGKVPDAGDTVYFDNLSFKSGEDILYIEIDDNAECFTLDFSRATKKIVVNKLSTTVNLRIYGSLILNPIITFNIKNTISFEALTKGHIIRTFGVALPNIILNGKGGSWSLSDDLVCDALIHRNGILQSNSNSISATIYSADNSSTDRELHLNNSVFNIKSTFNANGKFESFQAGKSQINITGSNTYFYSGGLKYHNINFSSNSGTSIFIGNAVCNKVEFGANANIADNCTFDSLYLSPGFIYEFKGGSQQLVKSHLNAIGNCKEYIFIKSSTDDLAFSIIKEKSNFFGEYLILQDVIAAGYFEFRADNSIDLDNNTNWKILGPSPRLLYWVGKGSKYWDDSMNWSLFKGGSGGACLPTPVDDVIFDNIGDGEEVIVRTATVLCKSMFWYGSNNVIFKNEGTYPIRIYGSLQLSESINYQIKSILRFESKEKANKIRSAGRALADLMFNGKGGEWTLDDDIKCNNVVHRNGIIRTMGHDVSAISYVADNLSPARELYLNNSNFNIKNTFNANGKYNVFDTKNSNIYITSANTYFYSGNQKYNNIFFTAKSGISNFVGNAICNKVDFGPSANITDNCTFDTLILSPGFIYEFKSGSMQTLKSRLVARGNCREQIFIKSISEDSPFTFYNIGGDFVGEYLILQDITAAGDYSFTAHNSIDVGNNTNLIINGANPRVLYWVGKGKSYWDDSNNWSLKSGGLGGECLPTPVDDVIFEKLGDGDEIIARTATVFCKSMIWLDDNKNCIFKNEGAFPLRIYGSLSLTENMQYQYKSILRFESREKSNKIRSAGQVLVDVILNGKGGEWSLEDEMRCEIISHKNGIFRTFGQNLFANIYIADNVSSDREIYLYNTDFRLKGNYNANGKYKVFDAGKSNIIISGSNSFFYNGGNRYHNVIFESESGTSIFSGTANCNKLLFGANGNITDNCTFDTLIFSPGYSYTLNANKTQTINKLFDARGNSCYPISIQSSNGGQQTILYKESGIVSSDFLSITDLKASGGATFYAGYYTQAIGTNNEGWIYSNAPGYIYGFGPDTILCKGDLLNTMNFNGAKSYLWHDGTTKPWHDIDISGLYWVIVTYGDNCQFTDSINIEIVTNAFVNLGNDVVVCNPNTDVTIYPQIKDGISPYEIFWEPKEGITFVGDSEVVISADKTTDFIMSVKSKNGCFARDTLQYIIVANFVPIIKKEGYYLVSNSTIGNQWMIDDKEIPGANDQRYLPSKSGKYSLIITDKNGCKSVVSEPVYFNQSDFGAPVLVCGSSTADPGAEIEIPVNLLNASEFQDLGITTLDFDLYYNPTLLFPIDFQQQIIDQNSALISMKGLSIAYDSGLPLTKIRFIAGLGNSEKCKLKIENPIFDNQARDILVFDGLFTLSGICYDGGARLVNPNSIGQLISMAPNPANDKLNIILNLIEKGETELMIYSILGQIVYRKTISNQTGRIELNLDLEKFNSGTYFINLQTPTIIKSDVLLIMK